jgi:hypothetical protein
VYGLAYEGKKRLGPSRLRGRRYRPRLALNRAERDRSYAALWPFRYPDLVAPLVKPNRPATFRKIALDLHRVRPDDLIACDADSSPAGAEPRHVAMLFREMAGEDLRTDAASEIVQFAQGASSQEVGDVA